MYNYLPDQVPFEEALELVRNRRVLLDRGNALVPRDDMIAITVGVFRARLSASLTVRGCGGVVCVRVRVCVRASVCVRGCDWVVCVCVCLCVCVCALTLLGLSLFRSGVSMHMHVLCVTHIHTVGHIQGPSRPGGG